MTIDTLFNFGDVVFCIWNDRPHEGVIVEIAYSSSSVDSQTIRYTVKVADESEGGYQEIKFEESQLCPCEWYRRNTGDFHDWITSRFVQLNWHTIAD